MCQQGFYNDMEGGECQPCPRHTHSDRHDEDDDHPVDHKDGMASTYCAINEELIMRRKSEDKKQTVTKFTTSHFSAETLCSEDADLFLENSHMCASKGIIGPISDLLHQVEYSDYFYDDETENQLSEDQELEEEEFELAYHPVLEDLFDAMGEDSQDPPVGRRDRGRKLQAIDNDDQRRQLYAKRKAISEHTINSQHLKENLFFFTDNDFFKSPRYEYLSPAVPTRGFVFGLFVQDTESLAASAAAKQSFQAMNQLSSLQEVNAHGYMEELKNFRVVKNLGRRVHSVHPFITPHMSGFEVEYIDGDYCLASPGQTYRSKVKYVCDPYGEENMVDYPLLEVPPTVGDYQGVNQCNFDFIWESRFACAPCTD